MGFFSWVVEKAEAAVEWGKEKVKAVRDGITNAWNKFSGKDIFEKAEQLYEEITTRYNSKRKQFDIDLENYAKSIERHVNAINQSKAQIKQELFPEMAQKMEKIKDIHVSQDFSVEAYKAAALSFDSIRSKDKLYKIDFNKHKFKTTFQAILTLGFYTRKKVKETLYAVQEEEKKIDAEIAKMDTELKKLQTIETALQNVASYFDELIRLYETLLVRLDNSVNYLYIRCISFARKLVGSEMSIRHLPKMQQKEVEAIITASLILKAMTDAQITAIENQDELKKYSKTMEQQHTQMKHVYEAA